ncbi:Period circadian protein [Temnothorax longispinosus]|uniref:Period circadian protein n=1 Tax=Temnothorax longispinosus TaxID=300112 RepID=A0A4S2K233_9HYME|nr:Period circadian protein [Temnothorax longispinosus]
MGTLLSPSTMRILCTSSVTQFLFALVDLVLGQKAPEETIISSVFTTRHTATCHLSHVDPDVVQYFGYLPQDMVGRSLFDFYHPEDLPFIKDIYETVRGRSRPSKFPGYEGARTILACVEM